MSAYEALVAAALERLHPTTLERMHRDGTAMFAKHPVKVDAIPEPEERETREFNQCHNPKGDDGGQFCATGGLEHLPPGFLEGSLIKQPLYHGSSMDVSRGLSPGKGAEYGIYLSPSRRYAGGYGENLHKVLVNVKRPLIVEGKYEISPRDLTREDAARLQAKGYDAVVVSSDGQLSGAQEVVIFDPAQAYLIREARFREFNKNHEPAGTPDKNQDGKGDGGQFAKKDPEITSVGTSTSATPKKHTYTPEDKISGDVVDDDDAVQKLLGMDAETLAERMTQYIDEEITTVKIQSHLTGNPDAPDPEGEEANEQYNRYVATAEQTARAQHEDMAVRRHEYTTSQIKSDLFGTIRAVMGDHMRRATDAIGQPGEQMQLPGFPREMLTSERTAEILMKHGIIDTEAIDTVLAGGQVDEKSWEYWRVRERLMDPSDAAGQAAAYELARYRPNQAGRYGYEDSQITPGRDAVVRQLAMPDPKDFVYDPSTFEFDPNTDIPSFERWYEDKYDISPGEYGGEAQGKVQLKFYGRNSSYIERTFTRDEYGLSVHHDYFENKGAGGQGKGLMRGQMELYEELGVDSIDTFANISTGAYAWARYGFHAEDPSEVRNRLLDKLDSIADHPEMGRALAPYRKQIDRLLDAHAGDPELPWRISDLRITGDAADIVPLARAFRLTGLSSSSGLFGNMTVSGSGRWNDTLHDESYKGSFNLGKVLLTGLKWQARFDMRNEAQRARLRDYVGDWTK